MAEQMKPSGIDWIGEIPCSWNIKRIKYLAQLKGRIGWQGLTSDEYTDVGPFLITGVDFSNGGINWENCVHITEERWAEAPEIHIKNGDLLITKDGTVGKVAIVENLQGKASLNSGVLLIKTSNDYNKKFLYWALLSEEFWTWFRLKNAGNSTIVHLYQNDFAEFSYTFPDATEQQAIADFLDKECAQIDSIAADLEKQIALLQQYKKSLITETVTKGLDKSVPMKDSGVEWIGEIPEYWRLKRLKYIAKLKTGTTPPGNEGINYDENGINWFTPSDFLPNMQLDTSEKYIDRETIRYENSQTYPRGSVLLVAIGATVGKIGISKNNAYSNQQITAVIPQHISGNYLLYYLASKSPYIKDNALYTTLPIINNSYLQNITIVVPPTTEQEKIVEFLNRKCSIIDELIEDKNKLLLRLQQHKKSLIYEYVTGKKRVKEVQ